MIVPPSYANKSSSVPFSKCVVYVTSLPNLETITLLDSKEGYFQTSMVGTLNDTKVKEIIFPGFDLWTLRVKSNTIERIVYTGEGQEEYRQIFVNPVGEKLNEIVFGERFDDFVTVYKEAQERYPLEDETTVISEEYKTSPSSSSASNLSIKFKAKDIKFMAENHFDNAVNAKFYFMDEASADNFKAVYPTISEDRIIVDNASGEDNIKFTYKENSTVLLKLQVLKMALFYRVSLSYQLK